MLAAVTNVSWTVLGVVAPFTAAFPNRATFQALPPESQSWLRTVVPPGVSPASPWANAVVAFTPPTVASGVRADVGGLSMSVSYVLQLNVSDGCSVASTTVRVQVRVWGCTHGGRCVCGCTHG